MGTVKFIIDPNFMDAIDFEIESSMKLAGLAEDDEKVITLYSVFGWIGLLLLQFHCLVCCVAIQIASGMELVNTEAFEANNAEMVRTNEQVSPMIFFVVYYVDLTITKRFLSIISDSKTHGSSWSNDSGTRSKRIYRKNGWAYTSRWRGNSVVSFKFHRNDFCVSFFILFSIWRGHLTAEIN